MKIQLTKKGFYIPKCWDNRKLDKAEQVTVEYTALSHNERVEFMATTETRVVIPNIYAAKDDDVDHAVEAISDANGEIVTKENDNPGMVKKMNPVTHNLFGEDGTPLEKWDDILNAPATPQNQLETFIAEIHAALPKTQERIDSKNSD